MELEDNLESKIGLTFIYGVSTIGLCIIPALNIAHDYINFDSTSLQHLAGSSLVNIISTFCALHSTHCANTYISEISSGNYVIPKDDLILISLRSALKGDEEIKR